MRSSVKKGCVRAGEHARAWRRTGSVLVAIACVAAGGCATPQRGPYQPQGEIARHTDRAERLTREAVERMDRDPKEAERLLRDALTADLFHGPAHNNLGVLFLRQGLLAPAAEEFVWAAKLMPDHPDPRLNLAMTFERAGRIGEAIDGYANVLEATPGHLPTMQALALCQVRYARTDERTAPLLREIAMRGEGETWRSWAQEALIKLEPES